MPLNEADSGLPVVEVLGPGRHGHVPGSTTPAPTLVSTNEQPLGWCSSPAPVHRRVVWVCIPLCRAVGLFPYDFGGSLSSPCTAGEPCMSTAGRTGPAQLESTPRPAQLERHPQVQLKNHLCISAIAGRDTEGTAGRETPAQVEG